MSIHMAISLKHHSNSVLHYDQHHSHIEMNTLSAFNLNYEGVTKTIIYCAYFTFHQSPSSLYDSLRAPVPP